MHIVHVDGKWACKFCGQLMKIQSSMFRHVAEKHAKILKQEHIFPNCEMEGKIAFQVAVI